MAESPVSGHYTDEPIAHVTRAWALANSLIGESFERFQRLSDDIQHNLLDLIRSELDQAKAALEAEAAGTFRLRFMLSDEAPQSRP
ncbi:hypothetical protein [Chitinimonas lacunae]|uniref:Uncharacterized protein n=1 Tax=Chitinimonas lacunae TaxID=1963018 RepID=A0ABV8MRM5_9NEIS